MVKYLVEQHGANVRADDDYALRFASERGHLDVVQYLVEQGADIHADNDDAVRRASRNGHFHILSYLMDQGANVRQIMTIRLVNKTW